MLDWSDFSADICIIALEVIAMKPSSKKSFAFISVPLKPMI